MDLLRKAWLLGPHGRGPNILLHTDPASPEYSSLFFEVPQHRVVAASGGGRRAAEAVAPGDAGDSASDGDESAAAAAADIVTVLPVRPSAACACQSLQRRDLIRITQL